jgi:hypothetical protein
MTFQLKHIKGVPYFLKDNRVYTFELEDGQPSKQCIAIGTYHIDSETITYDDGWVERIHDRLETFRRDVEINERDKLREIVHKPQKQRKSAANKSKVSRTKGAASV